MKTSYFLNKAIFTVFFFNLTPFYIAYECDRVKCLWSDLAQYFKYNLILPISAPQTAIFGVLDSLGNDSNKVVINHILIF